MNCYLLLLNSVLHICKEGRCEVIIGQECETHTDCNSNPEYLYNKCVYGVRVVDFKDPIIISG